MKYNKLELVFIRSITFLATIFTLLSFFTILTFAQSEGEEKEKMNQTIMQDISNSTNQPIQNVTNFGANITKGAKDLVGNIGEGLQNLTK